MTIIGSIDRLVRFPVKSMMGEDLNEVHVAFAGLTGDRIYALVDDAPKKPNFPWHSAREQHDLLLYRPRFRAAPPTDRQYPSTEQFAVEVTGPTGSTHAITDPDFLQVLQAKMGRRITLRFSEKGMQDSRPVSIFGLATARQLSEESGRELDPLRFRANIYARWNDDTPFFEDTLVGQRLKIGETLELLVVKKDPRCIIITLDPQTAEVHPEVLRTVAKKHQGCAGVYAVVVREGIARKGDAIELA